MDALAVIMEQPRRIALNRVAINAPGEGDVVVEIAWSGISTGTEKLLWSGTMPAFPGMGYPLVPGYEAVGTIIEAGPLSGREVGEFVFVPGAQCFGSVRGLFGAAASRLTLPGQRVSPVDAELGPQGVLFALAATAQHAIGPNAPPELIVGHGALGRLLARLTIAGGAPAPTVWEIDPVRMQGAQGYSVLHPQDDPRRDYRTIYDVSGDASLMDTLIARLHRGGELVLAGFYDGRLSFDFPPAFMKEARLRIASEFTKADLAKIGELVREGTLSLGDIITHRRAPKAAAEAYQSAFEDASCLKMIIDWEVH